MSRDASEKWEERLSDAEIRRMFSALDADGNGSVSLEELNDAAAKGKLGVIHSDAGALLSALDAGACS